MVHDGRLAVRGDNNAMAPAPGGSAEACPWGTTLDGRFPGVPSRFKSSWIVPLTGAPKPQNGPDGRRFYFSARPAPAAGTRQGGGRPKARSERRAGSGALRYRGINSGPDATFPMPPLVRSTMAYDLPGNAGARTSADGNSRQAPSRRLSCPEPLCGSQDLLGAAFFAPVQGFFRARVLN